jgi:hypothetical protein
MAEITHTIADRLTSDSTPESRPSWLTAFALSLCPVIPGLRGRCNRNFIVLITPPDHFLILNPADGNGLA